MISKLKQFKDLRSQAKDIQSKLSDESVDISEAFGKIKLTMDGNQKVTSLDIDPELLTPDKKGKLEKDLTDAFNSGVKKIQKVMAMKMKDMGVMDMFGKK